MTTMYLVTISNFLAPLLVLTPYTALGSGSKKANFLKNEAHVRIGKILNIISKEIVLSIQKSNSRVSSSKSFISDSIFL